MYWLDKTVFQCSVSSYLVTLFISEWKTSLSSKLINMQWFNLCYLTVSDTCCDSNLTVRLCIVVRLSFTCFYIMLCLWKMNQGTSCYLELLLGLNSTWDLIKFGFDLVLLQDKMDVYSIIFVFIKNLCLCVWMPPDSLLSADECNGHFPVRLSSDDKFTNLLSASPFPQNQ